MLLEVKSSPGLFCKFQSFLICAAKKNLRRNFQKRNKNNLPFDFLQIWSTSGEIEALDRVKIGIGWNDYPCLQKFRWFHLSIIKLGRKFGIVWLTVHLNWNQTEIKQYSNAPGSVVLKKYELLLILWCTHVHWIHSKPTKVTENLTEIRNPR